MSEIKIEEAQVLVNFDQLEYILLCAITLYILALLYCMMLFSGYIRNSVNQGRLLSHVCKASRA